MKFTAQQIATQLEGTVEGDPNAEVFQLSKIEEAQKGSLTFLSNPKYTPFIYKTQASVTIVNLIYFFESHPTYYLESNGDSLLIRSKERLASIQEIKQMLAFAEELLKILENK